MSRWLHTPGTMWCGISTLEYFYFGCQRPAANYNAKIRDRDKDRNCLSLISGYRLVFFYAVREASSDYGGFHERYSWKSLFYHV